MLRVGPPGKGGPLMLGTTHLFPPEMPKMLFINSLSHREHSSYPHPASTTALSPNGATYVKAPLLWTQI